ncbi:MAG: hypothetical protein QF442_02125 [Candidatus Peribacteraceae bacterium]|jgi:hypothetical protein|nr:hypothetical protein [Candidatus Peribacteraceae bacterium]
MEYIVFVEVDGSRRVGTVVDAENESIEERITLISTDLRSQFKVAERYELSKAAASAIGVLEEMSGGEDINLRRFAALIYMQGRSDMKLELADLLARQMEPKEN